MDSSNVELSHTFHLLNGNKSAHRVRGDSSLSVTCRGAEAHRLTVQNTEGFVKEAHKKKRRLQDCVKTMTVRVSILSSCSSLNNVDN